MHEAKGTSPEEPACSTTVPTVPVRQNAHAGTAIADGRHLKRIHLADGLLLLIARDRCIEGLVEVRIAVENLRDPIEKRGTLDLHGHDDAFLFCVDEPAATDHIDDQRPQSAERAV